MQLYLDARAGLSVLYNKKKSFDSTRIRNPYLPSSSLFTILITSLRIGNFP